VARKCHTFRMRLAARVGQATSHTAMRTSKKPFYAHRWPPRRFLRQRRACFLGTFARIAPFSTPRCWGYLSQVNNQLSLFPVF
jgi:hypothetical protein